ncbi:MAG: amidohydrolase [Euryarchaeota archaeon]|nr:amidohydrolase [Euryarchaeota archaeon]
MSQRSKSTYGDWRSVLEDLEHPVKELRHELHAHPELSDREEETAGRIIAYLSDHGLKPVADDVGGHGLLYTLEGEKGDGRKLLFRGDMDALPLHEKGDPPHASKKEGIHHACGHDGHMAMLTGALAALAARRDAWGGTIHALFQPSEETGQGGAKVLEHGKMQDLEVDLAFAFHNIPGQSLGSVALRRGTMACASTGVHVRFEGATSHASEPNLGKNPIPALAKLAMSALALPGQTVPFGHSALATLIHLDAGEIAYGTSAGSGSLRVTLRAAKEEHLDAMRDRFRDQAKAYADPGGFEFLFEEHERFPATVNHDAAVDHALRALEAKRLEVVRPKRAFPWSEDFGHITNKWPGALLGLGAGEDQPPLHTPSYDFPDALLLPGIRVWLALATGGEVA